jgi:hypothetical protein
MNGRMCKHALAMAETEGCDRSVCGAIGCLEASTENTREKGKQEVKQDETRLISCPFISCLKPIPKLALVLTDDPYIY